MPTLIWIAAMVLATVLFVEIVRRIPPALGVVVFLLVTPIALSLRFTGIDKASLFSLVKVGSVAIGSAYALALLLTRWGEHPAGRAVVHALLAINILEAVVAEAVQGKLINAAAGVLLVLAQASSSSVFVERQGAAPGLRYPLGGFWVAGYTLWNFTFVYGREDHGVTGAFAALAVVHLLASLLAMRGESARYIESRAFALTPMVVLRVVAPYPPFLMLSSDWYSPAVAGALRIASLALAAGLAARALATRVQSRELLSRP
jgi:hypothetical protein